MDIYYDMDNGGRSCIDHLNVQQSLCDLVTNVIRCDLALNPSKHLPVLVDLDLPHKADVNENNEESQKSVPISWGRVTDEHSSAFRQKQDAYLNNLKKFKVLECRDIVCKNESHRQEIDDLCSSLIDCCLKSNSAFPRIKKKKGKRP